MSQRDIRCFFGGGGASSKSSEGNKEGKLEKSKKRGKRTVLVIDSDEDEPKSKKAELSNNAEKNSSGSKSRTSDEHSNAGMNEISADNFFGSQTACRSFKPKAVVQKHKTDKPDAEVVSETSVTNGGKKPSLANKLKQRSNVKAGLPNVEGIGESSQSTVRMDRVEDDVADNSEGISVANPRSKSSSDEHENSNKIMKKHRPREDESISQENPCETPPRKKSKKPEHGSADVGGSAEIKTPTSKKSAELERSVLSPEDIQQRKSQNYRKFLERKNAQPTNPGTREVPEGSPNCLAGLTIVITGLLDNIGRDESTELCKRLGAKVTSAVSKNTSYLVTGSDPGASKTDKAAKLGTKVLDEEGFFELIRSKTKTTSSESKATDDGDISDSELSQIVDSQCSVKVIQSQSESIIGTTQATVTSGEGAVSQESSLSAFAPSQDTVSSVDTGSEKSHESRLWVDKYKPRSLKSVIGQQGDRSVANKLKQWLQRWHQFHTGANKVKVKAYGASFGSASEDGSNFKAALLSGPPGVGKTTVAQLVCAELGFQTIELNASDSRSKKLLDKYTDCLQTSALSATRPGFTRQHVLLMDEVDGMAGNQDRGGVGAVVQLLRQSRVPIICMCNDRQHPKIRSLAQYCFDLRVYRPRLEQIRAAMMSVCFKEKVKVSREVLDRLIIGTNQDVRQVLHLLSVLSADSFLPASSSTASSNRERASKDTRLGVFDVVLKVFSASARQGMSIDDKIRLFFNDYSLGPLFVQENYLSAAPAGLPRGPAASRELLQRLSQAADSLCDGDVVDRAIRSGQCWSLLPTYAVHNTLLTGELLAGHLTGRPEFPRWLGSNSSRNKSLRQAQELQSHMCLRVSSAGRISLLLDYVRAVRDNVVRPLLDASDDGASEAARRMFAYDLQREDLDQLSELCAWPGSVKDPLSALDTKAKSAFTRAVRGGQHSYPYACGQSFSSASRGGPTQLLAMEGEDLQSDGGDSAREEDEDVTADKMVKVKVARKATTKAPRKTAKGKAKK